MSIAAVIFIGSPLAAFLGLLLFVHAQRTQKTLACRRCDYDLSGSLDSIRCPECGNLLDGAGLRAPGEMRVRPIQTIVGLLMAAIGIVVLLLGGLPLLIMSF